MQGWKFPALNEFLVPFLLCQALWIIIQSANAADTGFEDEFYLALKMRSKRSLDQCPFGWSSFGAKCCRIFGTTWHEEANWISANEKCFEMGATLVSIHSKEEQDFVNELIRSKMETSWIGLLDNSSSGDRVFYWSDGSPLDFLNWDKDQPNNYRGIKQECVVARTHMKVFGKWNDQECSKTYAYICQIGRVLAVPTESELEVPDAHTSDHFPAVLAVPTESELKVSDAHTSDWHETALYASLGVALAIASVVALIFVIRKLCKPKDRNADEWNELIRK